MLIKLDIVVLPFLFFNIFCLSVNIEEPNFAKKINGQQILKKNLFLQKNKEKRRICIFSFFSSHLEGFGAQNELSFIYYTTILFFFFN